MNKIVATILLLVLIVIGGCKGQVAKDDVGESRNVNHFKITVKKVGYEPALKNDQLVTIDFNVENTSEIDFSTGASDFYLTDSKGKEYKINGNYINFGNEIKVGEQLKGQGFYQLPEKIKEFTLVYKPFTTVEAEWFIKVP